MSVAVDRKRYGRQIRLREIGEAGQERLASARARLGGRGAARVVEGLYLRAAGVGFVEGEVPAEHRASLASLAHAPPDDAVAGLAPLGADVDVETLLASLGIGRAPTREIAEGALRALVTIRAALAGESR